MKPVFTDFDDVDQFSPQAAEKYEEALVKAEEAGTHIRALMLCNPHNPLGQCYPKDTIIALMKLCNKYKIHLLCDEIYAASVYDVSDKNAVKFTSALSFETSPYISSDYLHVLYGRIPDRERRSVHRLCLTSNRRNEQRLRGWRPPPRLHIHPEQGADAGHELHHAIFLGRGP